MPLCNEIVSTPFAGTSAGTLKTYLLKLVLRSGCQYEIRTFACKSFGYCRTDPTPTTGDDTDFALEQLAPAHLGPACCC